MEYNFRDFENIERKSPVLGIAHALGNLSLTYENTAIFSYAEPFEFMAHIFHADKEMGRMTFYDSDELLEQLRGFRFPEYREPFPSDQEIADYFTYQSDVLEAELENFSAEVEDDEIDDDDPPGYRPSDWGWED